MLLLSKTGYITADINAAVGTKPRDIGSIHTGLILDSFIVSLAGQPEIKALGAKPLCRGARGPVVSLHHSGSCLPRTVFARNINPKQAVCLRQLEKGS